MKKTPVSSFTLQQYNMDAAAATSAFKGVSGILEALTILKLVEYQWPKPACVKDNDTFDFIVIGAGTGGCVVANRLIELGNVTVLLIEAGGYPPLETEMGGLFAYLKNTKNDWNFTAACSPYNKMSSLKGNGQLTQGKMIGGSGNLNYLGYAHGNKYDYERWAKITKDPTWSWPSVLKTFKKNEKLTDKMMLNSPDKHFYGTEGKINLKRQYYKRNEDYFAALRELGWKTPLDFNPKTPLGFTNFLVNIGSGRRQDSATIFLRPLKKNPNLHLMINTLATKIIFDDHKRAIGVEVITENNKVLTLKAKKEVIVAAGAIKSPQLLMLSGIGPKFHLESKGIKVIADLPVGQQFQDHVHVILVYKLTKANKGAILEDPHKYPFSIFVGSVALNQSQKYPDYEVIAATIAEKDIFLSLCASYFNLRDDICNQFSKKLETSAIFLVFITYLYPKSRGEVRLQSNCPKEYPVIIPGYYKDDEDVINHAKYTKDFNRILKTSYLKSLQAEAILPDLKDCNGRNKSGDAFWRSYVLGMSTTANYLIGSCAMGSVLDSKLRVVGVKGVRVADASVFPAHISTFTGATVIMVAQKAAEFIKKEHFGNKH